MAEPMRAQVSVMSIALRRPVREIAGPLAGAQVTVEGTRSMAEGRPHESGSVRCGRTQALAEAWPEQYRVECRAEFVEVGGRVRIEQVRGQAWLRAGEGIGGSSWDGAIEGLTVDGRAVRVVWEWRDEAEGWWSPVRLEWAHPLRKARGVTLEGNRMIVEDLGTVIFWEQYESRDLGWAIPVRFDLGSPVEGEIVVAELMLAAPVRRQLRRAGPPEAMERAGSPAFLGGGALETAAGLESREEGGLSISQWLRNDAGRTLGMGSMIEARRAYWYGVEIGRKGRAGAAVEGFEESEELQKAETTLVAVEVDSPLVAGGIERRLVEYRRGQGFGAQLFQLQGETGRHPLTVSLVAGNRAVYRREWVIEVGASEQDRPAAVAPARKAELGKVYSTPYRLVVNARRHSLVLVAPRMQTATGEVATDAEGLRVHQTKARKLMKQYSERRRGEQPPEVKDLAVFLREMAVWGLEAREYLFGKNPAENALVRGLLDQIPAGERLAIDTDLPSFPWEWIWEGRKRPPKAETLDAAGLKALAEGFWGVRYEIEVLPAASLDRMGIEEHRRRGAEAEVVAAVNPTAHPQYGPATLKDMEELDRRPEVAAEVLTEKSEVIDGLKRSGQTPHAYYFYCHHRAGQNLDASGFLRVDDSGLFLKGLKEEELTVGDLKDEEVGPFAPGEAPLVLLNACGTAQGGDYLPSGFIPYFLSELNAAAVVGTVAEVPAGDAREFGRVLLERWLGGERLGLALLELRREWLIEAANPNPFALYYTLHGSGEVKLEA